MTQEEKAKAYDEVREKIALRFGSNVADEIFSQFEMSDDERIRKELLDFCKNKAENFPNDPKYKNISAWIAWLEKQGQKPQGKSALDAAQEEKVDNQNCVKLDDKIKPKFKTGDRVIGIVSGMQYFITEVCDDHYNTESGCIIMFCSQDNFELYEQKPTDWSEEDENNILFLTSIIEECFKDKEKITLCGDTACADFTKEDVIDRLKSLRPQNTWKPNDEQMKALNNIIVNGHMFYSRQERELMNLYNDLKNLIKK